MRYDKGDDQLNAWSVTKSVGKKLDKLYHALPQNFENNSFSCLIESFMGQVGLYSGLVGSC